MLLLFWNAPPPPAPALYAPDWDTLAVVAQPFDPDLTQTVVSPPWPFGFGQSVFGGLPGSYMLAGTEREVFFADRTYISHDSDSPSEQWFKALLNWSFNYQAKLYQGNEPGDGSGSRIGYGNIDLINENGVVDILLNYAWDGRTIRLYRGRRANAFSTFELIFVGTGAGIDWTDNGVTILLRDRQAPFAKTLARETYGGTGGPDGDASITGQAKPLAYGRCFNIPAKLIGFGSQIYQVGVGPLQSIDDVRDKGASLTFAADYPNYDSLLSATVGPGFYVTCLALGLVRLGASAAGTITADCHGLIVNGLYVETTASIAKAIAMTRLGVDNFSDDGLAGFDELDLLQPAPIGWFCDDDSVTVQTALDEILGGAGGFWFASPRGILTVGRLDEPSGTPILSLRERNFPNGIGRKGIPASYRRQVGWKKALQVQSPDELREDIDDAARQLYGNEYRWAPEDRGAAFTMHRYARQVQTRGLFALESDAQAEAIRLADIYQTERSFYSAVVEGVDPFSDILGETVEIRGWGVARIRASGQKFRVIGMSYDDTQKELSLVLWG